jgi:cystathionine beta-lyase/cystathionine gamma-synthase
LQDAKNRLDLFVKNTAKVKKHIDPVTYAQIGRIAKQYIQEITDHLARLTKGHTEDISLAREYIHSHQVLFGALITSTDWQSPSYETTGISQAGRQTGKIYATINDYKRDQHWDTFHYEQAFLREYIDAFIKLPIHAHATSSGMSAFTTILMYLKGEKKLQGKILCGSSVYFQNRWLLLQGFADQLVFVQESDTKKILHAIDTHAPSVIFLDSLTNAPDVITPDIEAVIRHVAKKNYETHVVIDNTGLSIDFQPIPLVFAKQTHVRLIMFESLNKYHQFGMDRVSGGMIIAYGKGTDKLFDYRVHSGTIIGDAVAASLPTPNRTFLARRLHRHTQNTRILVDSGRKWIEHNPTSPFKCISYPAKGCYFTIQFKEKYNTVSSFKRFIALTLRIAKKYNTNLVAGTSFGLNTTRIYLTAIRSRPHTPFIRIAVGTEDVTEIEKMQHVLIQAYNQFH